MRNVRDMRDVGRDRTKLTIKVLIGLVAFLLVFIAYFFIAQPQINKFAMEKQNEGINYAVGSILASIQAQGYVEIPVGNQTLVLVPYVPQQNPQVDQGVSQ